MEIRPRRVKLSDVTRDNTDGAGRLTIVPVLSVTVFWAFVGTLYSLQIWWMSTVPGERINLRMALIWQAVYYLAWIPFTLLVWRATRGWRPEDLGWVRFFTRHVGFAILTAVSHMTVVTAIAGTLSGEGGSFAAMFIGQFRGRAHIQLLVYAAIAGTGHARVLYERYRERQMAAVRLEAQLTAARLEALQSHLQPHFLFNSLHTIASLARAGDNTGVVRLVADLSELLRHGLDNGSRRHQSVREEIDLVERYLAIQRVRFGDRLSVTVDVADDALAARVPLLVVQPLVENALRHGLGPKVGPGHVAVRIRTTGTDTEIEVEDDGVGLPAGWSASAGNGTGLRNLAARLEAEFGRSDAVTIHPAVSGGVTARVRIPRMDA